jgi:Fe-S-cluster containining protein
VSRVLLPVARDEPEKGLVACTECARCCTYVGVGINAPSRARYATDILWYLYHEKVHVYADGAGEWSVHFETRCRNLAPDLRCGVYPDRPHICRGFDNRTCEVNDPADSTLTFREPIEFLSWLRERRPRVYARVDERFIPPPLRAESLPGRRRRGGGTGRRSRWRASRRSWAS